MLELLNGAALLVAAAMVGNEFAVAAFVHPSFAKIPDAAHQAAANALARILGRVMPFWYALTLILSAAAAVVTHSDTRRWNPWLLTATALWVIAIVSTILWLVPINNRVASWTPGNAPAGWREDRDRWDGMHHWRTLLLFVAASCLAVGVLHSR